MAEEQTTTPTTTEEEQPAVTTEETPATETPEEETPAAGEEVKPVEEGSEEKPAEGDEEVKPAEVEKAAEAMESETTPAATEGAAAAPVIAADVKAKIAAIDALRKLFIGGLSRDTTEEKLKEFFEQFGAISECTIIKDPSKVSRGFGFITFETVEEVDKCLEKKTGLTLDDRQIEVKRAIPKDGQGNAKSLRVYLGRVKEGLTEEIVKEYFEKNFTCTVESVELMRERSEGLPEGQTPKLRGFGFITFDNPDAVDKVIIVRNHEINGITITANKAEPKNSRGGRGGWGGRGGFSGGRGGFGGGWGGGYQRGGGGGFRGGDHHNNQNSFNRFRPY